MTVPIPVMVRRYECPRCGRRRASKQATAAHIGRCWLNPANRTCKTCKYFKPAGCCGMPDVYDCYTPMCPTTPTCDADVDLSDGNTPRVGCPRWLPYPTGLETTR